MQKSIFITGATGGLGSATCKKFAQHGYRVAIGYLGKNEQLKAQQLMEELTATHHMIVACNIDSTVSIQQAKLKIEQNFGTLSALVNNAGWTKFVAHRDLQGLTDDLIQGILRTHVQGYFACVRELEPILQQNGCIINISSIAGNSGIGSNIAYCAAKGAVDVMTRSLARALAPKLRVIAVGPGVVDTGIIKGLDTSWFDEQRNRTPMKRFAQPADIASTIYGCVEHLIFTTGMTVYADGGRLLEESL